MADLIATIQATRVPIICVCNDKYAQKLRSLRNHCLELDFRWDILGMVGNLSFLDLIIGIQKSSCPTVFIYANPFHSVEL